MRCSPVQAAPGDHRRRRRRARFARVLCWCVCVCVCCSCHRLYTSTERCINRGFISPLKGALIFFCAYLWFMPQATSLGPPSARESGMRTRVGWSTCPRLPTPHWQKFRKVSVQVHLLYTINMQDTLEKFRLPLSVCAPCKDFWRGGARGPHDQSVVASARHVQRIHTRSRGLL